MPRCSFQGCLASRSRTKLVEHLLSHLPTGLPQHCDRCKRYFRSLPALRGHKGGVGRQCPLTLSTAQQLWDFQERLKRDGVIPEDTFYVDRPPDEDLVPQERSPDGQPTMKILSPIENAVNFTQPTTTLLP